MSEDVKEAVRRVYEALNAGDIERFVELLSSDESQPLFIGTGGPEEWRQGRQAIIGALQEQFRDYPGLRFEAGEMHVIAQGDVAWIAERPTMRTPDGASAVACLTALLRREEGSWRLVASHLSLGVPDW